MGVLVELLREPLPFRRADVAFLMCILHRLARQSQPSRCLYHVQHAFRHARDRQAFVRRYIARRQIAAMCCFE
jgi:hypothetical protein